LTGLALLKSLSGPLAHSMVVPDNSHYLSKKTVYKNSGCPMKNTACLLVNQPGKYGIFFSIPTLPGRKAEFL
jgi:hypothetical protein